MTRAFRPSPARLDKAVRSGRTRPASWAILAASALPLGCGGGEAPVEAPASSATAATPAPAPTPPPVPHKGDVKNVKNLNRPH